MSRPAESKELTVVARAPFHIYYEGTAQVVSGVNKVGQFDVLPGHADFFSLLSKGDIIIETTTTDEPIVFTVNNGIIAVRENEVMLLVNM